MAGCQSRSRVQGHSTRPCGLQTSARAGYALGCLSPPYLVRVTPLEFPGVHRSPNIVDSPAIYEVENRAADRESLIESAMHTIKPWEHMVLADIGAGTGFHAVR